MQSLSVLLLWPKASVLHLRLPLEPLGLGKGACAVELCPDCRPGGPADGHPRWTQWAVARCEPEIHEIILP